jgi:hypothetical protein
MVSTVPLLCYQPLRYPQLVTAASVVYDLTYHYNPSQQQVNQYVICYVIY